MQQRNRKRKHCQINLDVYKMLDELGEKYKTSDARMIEETIVRLIHAGWPDKQISRYIVALLGY